MKLKYINEIWGRITYIFICRPFCLIAIVVVIISLLRPLDDCYSEYVTDGVNAVFAGTVKGILPKDYGGVIVYNLTMSEVDIIHCDDTGGRKEGFSLAETNRITKRSQTVTASFDNIDGIKIGQRCRWTGEISLYENATNPGQFDYLKYNHNKGNLFGIKKCRIVSKSKEYSRIKHKLYEIRLAGEGVLATNMSSDNAAIMKAMIFGNKSELDEDVKESFQKNGIAHILAISGLHISFMGMLIFNLLRRVGLQMSISVAISEGLIIIYGIMVGFSPSASRAIIMFSLILAGRLFKRTYDMVSAISIALTILLIWNNGYIRDTGLLLSFGAVIGVGVFYKLFCDNIYDPPGILAPFFVSLFVFLTTLPVLISSYHQVAFYSVILNLFIIPLMSVLLISTIIMIFSAILLKKVVIYPVMSVMLSKVTKVSCYIAESILYMYKGVCARLEHMQLGRVNIVHPGIIKITAFYIIMILFLIYTPKVLGLVFKVWKRDNKLRDCCGQRDAADNMCYKRHIGGVFDKELPSRLLIFIFSVVLLVVIVVFNPVNGLSVWMLDVGQGDCMVVRNDNGHVYVIDGGSSDVKKVGERRIIPFLKYIGTGEIESVIVTHPDSDHMNGIEELFKSLDKECIRVNNLVIYEGFKTDISFEGTENTKICLVNGGDSIKDGDLVIDILYPYKNMPVLDSNNASLVCHVSHGDFDMITTGDVESAGERWIVQNIRMDRDIEVLKVAHHGSSTSTSEEFLDWAKPEIALISVPKNSPYGHPHKETMDRLKIRKSIVYTTKDMGAICVSVGKRKSRISGYIYNIREDIYNINE